MTFKQLLILLLAATGLLWAGWIWTLFSINPLATNWLGFVLFYFTFFLALTGALTLSAVAVRKWRQPDVLVYHAVVRSTRQAVALSLFSVVLLLLQGLRVLRWWNALIVVALIAGFETIVLRRQHKRRPSVSPNPSMPQEDDAVQPLFIRKEMEE